MEKRKYKRGYFIVVDGLDAIGKGVVERALIEYEQKIGKAVFDGIAFSKANRKGLAELQDFWNPPHTYYDTIVTAEPTYSGIGHIIRNEIISKNSRSYDLETKIQAYSLDRLVQMKRTVIPALTTGLNVIQARCCAATLAYQLVEAEKIGKNIEKTKEHILEQEGNKLQLKWAPDLLIIPTIKNIKELMGRLEKRKLNQKDDNSIFDNIEFQKKLKPIYESNWLRKLFEKNGTTVFYIDAGISEQHTREEAVKIYKNFLENPK